MGDLASMFEQAPGLESLDNASSLLLTVTVICFALLAIVAMIIICYQEVLAPLDPQENLIHGPQWSSNDKSPDSFDELPPKKSELPFTGNPDSPNLPTSSTSPSTTTTTTTTTTPPPLPAEPTGTKSSPLPVGSGSGPSTPAKTKSVESKKDPITPDGKTPAPASPGPDAVEGVETPKKNKPKAHAPRKLDHKYEPTEAKRLAGRTLYLIFLVVFFYTSGLSASGVLRPIYFGEDSFRRHALKSEHVSALISSESLFYPNLTDAVDSNFCGRARTDAVVDSLDQKWGSAALAARSQLERFTLLECLRVNSACTLIPTASMSELLDTTDGCARNSINSLSSQGDCVASSLSFTYGFYGGEDCERELLRRELRTCEGSWPGLPLPFPDPQKPSREDVIAAAARRAAARVDYDREYIAGKLDNITQFLSNVSDWHTKWQGFWQEWNSDLDGFYGSLEKCNLWLNTTQDALESMRTSVIGYSNELESVVATARARATDTENAVRVWARNAYAEVRDFKQSVESKLASARAKVASLRRAIDSVLDAIDLIVDIVTAPIRGIIAALDWLFTLLGTNWSLSKVQTDIQNWINQTVAWVFPIPFPKFDLFDVSLDNIELEMNTIWTEFTAELAIIPEFEFPAFHMPPLMSDIPDIPCDFDFPSWNTDLDLSLPEPDEGLLDWFGDDYEPPSSLSSTFNASLGQNVTLPSLDLNLDVNVTFDAVLPDFEAPTTILDALPSIDNLFNILVYLDTGLLFVHTLILLRRLLAHPEPDVFVEYDQGHSSAVLNKLSDLKGWKAWLRLKAAWVLRYVTCARLSMCLGFAVYASFMLIYVQMLAIPAGDPDSWVYKTPGPTTLRSSLHDFNAYNTYNGLLTEAANACISQRQEYLVDVISKEQEVSESMRLLDFWAFKTMRETLGLSDDTIAEWPGISRTYLDDPLFRGLVDYAPDGSDLCECVHRFYEPAFTEERALAALDTDATLYVSTNASILKANFFLWSIIVLRIVRMVVMRILGLARAYASGARVHVVMTGFWNMSGEPIPSVEKAAEKWAKGRDRKAKRLFLGVLIGYAIVFAMVTWNARLDAELALVAPSGKAGCVEDAECDPLPCKEVTCDTERLACVYRERVCDDGRAETEDVCNIENDACESRLVGEPPLPDSGDYFKCPGGCGDGNACTDDLCTARGCLNRPRRCPPSTNPCLVTVCDPENGCGFQPVSCDDGDVCTKDTCDSTTGECRYQPVVCNDGDGCTRDTCRSDTGCVSEPVVCSDGVDCTVDTCLSISPFVFQCDHAVSNSTCQVGGFCETAECVPSSVADGLTSDGCVVTVLDDCKATACEEALGTITTGPIIVNDTVEAFWNETAANLTSENPDIMDGDIVYGSYINGTFYANGTEPLSEDSVTTVDDIPYEGLGDFCPDQT